MARNEEKQQGRLNRLWLQKEREEGRIKDVHEPRPKLSALNSASSVKKWIPSIKSEIEYYLQQSQLLHYPVRKIAEFQLCIQDLEREYKRFITKLRVLDPTCKHQPWTPRAYTKKRASAQDSPGSVHQTVKKLRCCVSDDNGGPLSGAESYQSSKPLCDERQGCFSQGCFSQSEAKPGAPVQNDPSLEQDMPLSFDHTRLAVAVAAFRGPAVHPVSSHTQDLARVLQAGLPNLQRSGNVSRQHTRTSAMHQKDRAEKHEPSSGSNTDQIEKTPEPVHVLGLGCYSSSDEESDT